MWAPFCDDYTINPQPKMHNHLCKMCGVLYADYDEEDGICQVCVDEMEGDE